MELMVGVSEDCQYICTERNGVTSQKKALFIVYRENLNLTLRLRNVTLCWGSPFHHARADNYGYGLLRS